MAWWWGDAAWLLRYARVDAEIREDMSYSDAYVISDMSVIAW